MTDPRPITRPVVESMSLRELRGLASTRMIPTTLSRRDLIEAILTWQPPTHRMAPETGRAGLP